MTINEMLELERPLVFLDIEGTGKSVTDDRIVELGMVRVTADVEPGGFGRRAEERFDQRFNPGVPIAPDAIAVHGITEADVAESPAFDARADRVWSFVAEVDFAGYNLGQYDLPLLTAELARCGHELEWETRNVIDVQHIFFKENPRDLSAAFRRYAGRELEGAHGAMADAAAVIEILEGQLTEHDHIPRTAVELDTYCRRKEWADRAGKIHIDPSTGELVFGFGKNTGRPILAHRDYCHWIIDNDFPRETKQVLRAAFEAAARS